jgi:hypothetical protein
MWSSGGLVSYASSASRVGVYVVDHDVIDDDVITFNSTRTRVPSIESPSSFAKLMLSNSAFAKQIYRRLLSL